MYMYLWLPIGAVLHSFYYHTFWLKGKLSEEDIDILVATMIPGSMLYNSFGPSIAISNHKRDFDKLFPWPIHWPPSPSGTLFHCTYDQFLILLNFSNSGFINLFV